MSPIGFFKLNTTETIIKSFIHVYILPVSKNYGRRVNKVPTDN